MARRISSVFGCALRPGVSLNGRLYTKEMIAAAVAEAQCLVQSGEFSFTDRQLKPNVMTQRTHHAAEDDSTRIVGRVTSLTLDENGNARFVADLADTPHGRTIDALVQPKASSDPDEVEAFLKGVSIRGAWTENVRTVMHNGEMVQTADGLIIEGLDYTARPGVPGAEIDGYMSARSLVGAQESAGRVPIYESIMEGQVEMIEEKGAPALKSGNAAAAPTKAPAGSYADPGYQGDKAKRYPLDTVKHAKAAWSYINQADNAKAYTAAQLKRIKGRIRAALKKFGVEVSEGWLISRGEVTESWPVDPVPASDTRPASFCVTLDNGMVCVTVSSYCVDPHDLDALGRAAMTAACAALDKLDPDCDGDMDVPGAPSADTDDDMTETAAPAALVEEAQTAPEPVADETPREEEAAVSEPVTPASEAPAAITPETPAVTKETSAVDVLSAKFDTLVATLSALVPRLTPAPAEAAPVAPVAETVTPTPPQPAVVTETEDQRVARLVEAQMKTQRTALIQELVESGQVAGRKGLVAPVNETATLGTNDELADLPNWPMKDGHPKEAHDLTPAEWLRATGAHLEQAVMGSRSVYRQQ